MGRSLVCDPTKNPRLSLRTGNSIHNPTSTGGRGAQEVSDWDWTRVKQSGGCKGLSSTNYVDDQDGSDLREG